MNFETYLVNVGSYSCHKLHYAFISTYASKSVIAQSAENANLLTCKFVL